MPPKRKAPAPKAEPAPKRSSREKAAPAPKKSTTTSSSSKAKSKSKSSKVITIDSSEEESESDEDVMVVEEKPVASSSKSKSKAKKESAPKKDKAAPKAKLAAKGKSKAAIAATAPISPEPDSPPPTVTKSKASPKKALSFEDQVKQWFDSFTEDEDDKKNGIMNGEGIEKMFEDMGISMEGVAPFLLAWKLNSKPGSFGQYSLANMQRVFREPKITTSPALKKYLQSVEASIYPSAATPSKKKSSTVAIARPEADEQLRNFYTFLFPFLKEEGQRSLNGEMAVAVWSVVLAPRYPIAKSFVEFAATPSANIKGVSQDVWSQLLEFVSTVGDDLSGWSEEDAWPSHIDAFVAWKKEQDQNKA